MTENYTDIMKTQWNEIPEPKTLPVGSWLLGGRNASFVASKEEGQDSKFLFFYTPREPMDDVDEEQLAALGPEYDITENDVVYTIWVNRKRDFDKVRKHLAKHGIEVNPAEAIEDTLKLFRNTQIIAYLNQRSFTNKAGEVVTENQPTSFVPVG